MQNFCPRKYPYFSEMLAWSPQIHPLLFLRKCWLTRWKLNPIFINLRSLLTKNAPFSSIARTCEIWKSDPFLSEFMNADACTFAPQVAFWGIHLTVKSIQNHAYSFVHTCVLKGRRYVLCALLYPWMHILIQVIRASQTYVRTVEKDAEILPSIHRPHFPSCGFAPLVTSKIYTSPQDLSPLFL